MKTIALLPRGSHGFLGAAPSGGYARRLRELPFLWPHSAPVDCEELSRLKLELRVGEPTYGATRQPDKWSRLEVRVEHSDSLGPTAPWDVLEQFPLLNNDMRRREVSMFKRYLRARWCISRPGDDTGLQVFNDEVEFHWSLTGTTSI